MGDRETRIVYQLVAPMEATLGVAEMERRRRFLEEHAAAGSRVEVRSVARGTASIESAYDAAMVIPHIIDSLVDAAAEGADAMIVGCFSDPGLDAVRECTRRPVVGPGMSAIHLAAQLGDRFAVISPNEAGSGGVAAYVRQLALGERFVSVRGMGLSVLQLAEGEASAMDRIAEVGQRCIEQDRADVVILGCMSMAFLGITGALQERLGVPVVSPVIAALKTAEMMAAHDIAHSRLGWPAPPAKPILDRAAARRTIEA